MDQELMAKSNWLLHPDWIMARMMVPAGKQVSTSAWVSMARVQQARTAIALERFFVKQAKYPAHLDELVPEFLPGVPLDPCDGKPLRYRRESDGHGVVWSIGKNRRDDDAKFDPKAMLSDQPDRVWSLSAN